MRMNTSYLNSLNSLLYSSALFVNVTHYESTFWAGHLLESALESEGLRRCANYRGKQGTKLNHYKIAQNARDF